MENLLRRGVLPVLADVRSLVVDVLAQPDWGRSGFRPCCRRDCRLRQDPGDQTVRILPGDRRHDGAAQERDVSDRCQASEPGAREAGAASALTEVGLCHSYAGAGKFALIKCRRCAHAKQFKRARRALKTLRTYLGRVMRHQPQDGWRRRARGEVFEAVYCWRAASASSSSASAGQRCIRCMRRRSNVSARARPIAFTSSALRSPSQNPLSQTWDRQFVTHVKALPSNPYHGHTLQTVIPDM
ncbi:hypothetical protein ABIB68_008201 [Bradyrhizobium sp. F1.2.2]